MTKLELHGLLEANYNFLFVDVIPRKTLHGITEVSYHEYESYPGWLVGGDTGELWAQSRDTLPGSKTGWYVC